MRSTDERIYPETGKNGKRIQIAYQNHFGINRSERGTKHDTNEKGFMQKPARLEKGFTQKPARDYFK